MSINLQKMKEKLAALNSKGDKKSAFWRPQDGEQTIRIVPTADGDPFKEFFFHYNLGNNPGFLCPKRNFGDDCPVCNFVRTLYNEGDEESVKMAKSLNARQRFFSPVVVRGEEEEGARVWGYGKMAYQELLNLVLNPDYGDITDTEDGTDLLMKYGKPPGASFPQTSLTPRRRSSALVEEKAKIREVLDQVPDFAKLFESKTGPEIQAMLDEFLLGEEDAEDISTETKKYSNTETDAVDKAFAELMA